MTRPWWRGAWLTLLLGTALAALLLAVARPAHILELATQARPELLLAAFGGAATVTAVRGLRLRVVVGAALSTRRALGVHAVSQFAMSVLPLRLGEAAILPLLHRAGVHGLLRGLSFAFTVRLLDLVAVLAWATVAGVWLGVRGSCTGPLLAAVALTVAAGAALGERLLLRLAQRRRRGPPLGRRVLRQALQVRGELRRLMATPGRAVAALALSLAAWGGVWWVTVLLLRAMDLSWPAAIVLWGTLGATAGAALPINAVGNFGSLEVGWTAALAAVGIPAGQALAAGFATHAWSLAFNAALAAAGAPVALRQTSREAAAARPATTARRSA